MHLKNLSLFNYKNFSEANFQFDSKINCFVGKNGIGKTNVLDAIYHLAHGKSYFNSIAIQNIKHGEEFFVIDGEFEKNNRNEQIVCSIKKGNKKILKRNGKNYDKFSEHIGFIPLVIISPADNDLITDGSETRRKFLDTVISQLDSVYLNQLIGYQKVINQRNALLKYFALNHVFDVDNLDIYNEQLQQLGTQIFEKRKLFLDDFSPIFNKYYIQITNAAESVQLIYDSQLFDDSILNLLRNNLAKDRVLQYTSAGIHKDDLLFQIEGFPIKKFG
ncbi:MAG: DNA replication and repair protein RecF, partial [Flavobacterium sp.]|nr:DNA replication and repair protein RecF [Flavobacterium sp.]